MRESAKVSLAEEDLPNCREILGMVHAANAALVHTDDELSLLKEFCRIIVEKGGYAFAGVGWPKSDGVKSLAPVASWGETDDFWKSLSSIWEGSKLERSPAGVAMRTGEAYLCRDIPADPTFGPCREAMLARGFTACLALPLSTPEQPLGALTIFADDTPAFQSGDVDALLRLAETLAFGVMARRVSARNRQLQEELSRKTLMLDFAGEAIFVHDLAGHFLEFNRATHESLGYSEDNLRKLNCFQMEPPAHAKLQEERLQQLLAEGEAVFESAYFHRDSSMVPLSLRSRMVEADGQKVILTAAQNTSDRKRAADALQECQNRLQKILELAQLGVFRLRLSDGRLEEANRRMAEMFGYDDLTEFLQEYPSAPLFANPNALQEMQAAVTTGKLVHLETTCCRKDGSSIQVQISACPAPTPGVIEGIATDISGLKRLKEELQKSEQNYRLLVEQQLGRSLLYAMEHNRLQQDLAFQRELTGKVLDTSKDAVLAFDRNFRLALWNNALEAVTGLSKTLTLNNSLFEVLPIFRKMQETGGGFVSGPPRQIFDSSRPLRLSPSSPEGYFDGHFFPLGTEGGEVIGGLVVIRNLTELRKVETALEERDRLLAVASVQAAPPDEPPLHSKPLSHRTRVKGAPRAVSKEELDKDDVIPQTAPIKFKKFREMAMARAEKEYLQNLMQRTDNDIKEASRLSNLSIPRLYALLKKHGVNRSAIARKS
jgi:PAS domain S-box-containing protein